MCSSLFLDKQQRRILLRAARQLSESEALRGWGHHPPSPLGWSGCLGSDVRARSGASTWLQHSPAVRLWASYLTAQNLPKQDDNSNLTEFKEISPVKSVSPCPPSIDLNSFSIMELPGLINSHPTLP